MININFKKIGLLIIIICTLSIISTTAVSAKSYTYYYDIYNHDYIFGAVTFNSTSSTRNFKDPFYYNFNKDGSIGLMYSDSVKSSSFQVYNQVTGEWEKSIGFNKAETAMIAYALIKLDKEHCNALTYNNPPDWFKMDWTNTIYYCYDSYYASGDYNKTIEVSPGASMDHDYLVFRFHKKERKE